MAARRVAVSFVRLLLFVGGLVGFFGAPGAEAQQLSAALRIPSPGAGTPFGGALAVHDGKVAIGGGFAFGTGVYVYDATAGDLLLVIPNPTDDPSDRFGAAVAWVGDDVLVGAPLSDVDGVDRGVAYVFDGNDGSLLHTLTCPNMFNTWCGYAVAGIGDDAIVGSGGPLGLNGEGAYLFDGVTGAHIGTFQDPNGGTTSAGRFGERIVVDGSDVFISSAYGASAVYRFDASGTLLTTYDDPEVANPDEFGEAIAVSGTHLALSRGLNASDGKVYLYDVATGALEHTYTVPFFADSLFFGESLGGIPGAVAIGSHWGVFVHSTSPPYDLLQQLYAPGPYADDRDGFGREQAPTGTGGLVIGAFQSAYVFDLCGNGVQTAREQCDDGNTDDGDGCSASCVLETCGPAPAAGCVMATKSSIAIRLENSIFGVRDYLKWTWAGPATAVGLFGDPLTTADFSLCVYDRTNGPTPRLRMQPAMLAGGSCGTQPCWKTKATKLSYADKDRTPSGIERFVLGTGAGMKALVIGKGQELDIPAYNGSDIDLQGQVTAQLRSSTSATCLQADFPLPAVFNAKGVFKDKTQ